MLRRMMMAAGGGGGASYWNPADNSSEITLSSGNADALRSSTNNGSWRSVRGVTVRSSGKYYAECVDVVDGALDASMIFGVATSAASLSSYCGSDAYGWGGQTNNTINRAVYHSGTFTDPGSGAAVTAGGRGLVAVDFSAGNIWLGSYTGGSTTWYGGGDPATGAVAVYTFTPGTALYLMLSMSHNPQECLLKNNTGENAGTIPSGFAMWG